MDGRHQGLVTQNSGRMYKDCQRQKLVENVDSAKDCRLSAMRKIREEEEEEECYFEKKECIKLF